MQNSAACSGWARSRRCFSRLASAEPPGRGAHPWQLVAKATHTPHIATSALISTIDASSIHKIGTRSNVCYRWKLRCVKWNCTVKVRLVSSTASSNRHASSKRQRRPSALKSCCAISMRSPTLTHCSVAAHSGSLELHLISMHPCPPHAPNEFCPFRRPERAGRC